MKSEDQQQHADIMADSPELQALGRRVRQLRAGKGLSRKALSERAEVSERHLAQLETGKGNISVLLLSRLARALDSDLGDIFRNKFIDNSMEAIMINDLIHQINPEDRQRALQLLLDQFVKKDKRKRRLALIGLRGAGKSTLGKKLASDYGLPFIQLVNEIQRLAGMNISEIFSLSGQEYYRRLEEKALMDTLQRHDNCIIETGGSIVTDLNLLNLLLKSCFVVWISTRPEEHMQRVIDQGDMRPIQNNDDAMSDLRRIVQQRETLYKQAHAHLDTSGRTVEESLLELSQLFPR
jgi:XRE family transcriptional regulator, aerobic/anaerobic benzoate catabolism transcriptional regulator